ncbi:hypothetical protein C8R45DRAFT_825970 [Mycena sanguinolenta]|nr:hypothetical protein C8R45DRAFT_825970 [Mycena sanguinolenta]
MVALEALHNSAGTFPHPKCHPETRTELLEKLCCWATEPHSDCSIQWLHGPAGAGKSAVMQTLCQRLQDTGQLGGSFFFKRGHQNCSNATKLFATLAYQLALHRRELKSLISQSIESNPSVLGRGMDVQLGTLIIEPCKALRDTKPLVLLVDGLDECEGHDIQRAILCLFGSTVKDHCLPIRILVASRPEPHIREAFEQESLAGLFDSTHIEQSFEDIRIYLCDEFSRIHREHSTTMQQIPTPWPSPQILAALVQNSSGYFIYASTVIKFIDDEYSRPSTQLDIIRNLVPHDSESPFEALDKLYLQILSKVPVRFHPGLCDILCAVINYPGLGAEAIDELLGLEVGDAQLILRPLHSVLKFSTEHGQIYVHHASFRDFLNNQERSSIFYVGSLQHRAKLARLILKALSYKHDDLEQNRADRWFRWYVPT